jgi:membrane protease YdiL (CAAX protease family)
VFHVKQRASGWTAIKWRWAALLLSAVLLIYGNGISFAAQVANAEWAPSFYPLINTLIAVALLLSGWAGVRFLSPVWSLPRQIAIGLAAGVAMAAIPAASFLVAPFVGEAVQWEPAVQADFGAGVWRLLVVAPFGVALFEEVVFRGLLDRVLRAGWGAGWASFALGLLVFALWHLVVSWVSVSETQYGGSVALQLVAYAASLGAVAVGGAIFLALRRWSEGLLAPVVAHWAVNSTMTLVLLAA